MVAFVTLLKEPLNDFKSSISYVVLGIFGAILGNISAVGGGIVFIPAFMFIYKLPPVLALKISLLTQSFGMTSGAFQWAKRGVLQKGILKVAVPSLLLGSTISSLIFKPSAIMVKALFGPVSILLGVTTLFFARKSTSRISLSVIPDKAKPWIAISAFIGGLVTGWIAIGEGEIVAATLILGFAVAAETAIGVGVILLSINSIFLALVHSFFLGGLPWSIGLFTALGAIFGARIAVSIGQALPSYILKLIFSVIAIGDGVIFIFQYFRST
jgi:uncharacterized membrane protein YfcA